MKKILLGILIVILGLASVNLYKRFTEDSDFKVKFHVYSQSSGKPLEILFRTIPTLYDTMIDVDIIEPYNKELILYKVNNDIYGGTPELHYVAYNKANREISYLKSDLLFRELNSSENIDLDTIDSYSVDILTFRQIYESHLKSSEEYANKYAELLANSLDSANFRRIKQSSDIESIVNSHLKTQPQIINENNTIKDFGFINYLRDDEFLFWFYDMGLIKMQLNFKDGHLIKVKTLRIGYLGVEITHL